MDIVLTSNSPGEVATWLRPTVRAFRKMRPEARIVVFLPPCNFAGGREKAVVAAFPEVDAVFGPADFLKFAVAGRRPKGYVPRKQGAVLFLGGDQAYAAWLARRLNYPAFAYTEGFVQWKRSYTRFFVPYPEAAERALQAGAHPDQVEEVGDLMGDAVQPTLSPAQFRSALGLSPQRDSVALFPGSRPYELRMLLPFFLRVAELIERATPGTTFLASISPFVEESQIEEVLTDPAPILEGVSATVERLEGRCGRAWMFTTPLGVRVCAVQGHQYDVMASVDIGLTIPGSNTAEMGHAGLPMVVVMPLNRPEQIPLEGIPGLISGIPGIGPRLKSLAVMAAARRMKYVAWPNRRANKELVAEIRGEVRADQVAERVVGLLKDSARLRAISAELKAVMGGAGAADRLASRVLQLSGL